MVVPPDKFDAGTRNGVMEFLRTELATALIFASLAEGQRNAGYNEAAQGSAVDSEKCWTTLMRVMSEPTCARHLTVEEQAEFAAMLDGLRKKLDSFKGYLL